MIQEASSHNLRGQIDYHSPAAENFRAGNNGILEDMSIKNQPELELLLNCLKVRRSSEIDERVKALLGSEINWDDFLGLAMQHAVIPLVYKDLSGFSQNIPSTVLDRLKHLTQINSFHNLYLTNELLKLLSLLESNGIKTLPYKGPVLAEFAYGDISLRQFGDLDILVPKKDVLKTKELFHSINYFPKDQKTGEQDEAYMNSGRPYNYKFLSANGKVSVELHWKFTSKYNSFSIDYNRIMDNLLPVKIGDKTVRSLRTEDLLVILCQHNSKHFWTRLLWVCDIARLIDKNPDTNWAQVIEFSTQVGAKRMLFLGLHLARTLLNAPLPDVVIKQIEADRKVKKLTDRVIEQLTSGAEKSIQGFEAHLFSCEMRERWRDKTRYSVYHFMPPKLAKRLFLEKRTV